MFVAIYICILPTIPSADHKTTRLRIGTSCTDTKDQANTGAMLKKCFRKLTTLQTRAAFSLLPSRLRCLEEKRYRKRNQLEIEREGREGEGERRLLRKYLSPSTILHPTTTTTSIYTDKLLQISNKSALPSANWFLSLPVRLPTPKARIRAPVLNGDRGSV